MNTVNTVSEITALARTVMEDALGTVWVEGEISNFKRHGSGHCYFSLKDEQAQIRCVMWRYQASRLFFTPQNGMLVRLVGQASVYEARGDLQLIAKTLAPAGEGALQKAFEALKERLYHEGLFDQQRKKQLPRLPTRIGIITSKTGAAIQDMLSVLGRRFPMATAILAPVPVQGPEAAPAIAQALGAFNALPETNPLRPDVLILGRGGGSIEDLWAFNEESVARAISASDIPVVSAVGHETDVTISDFVADVRAATPSMAAELVAPDANELKQAVQGMLGFIEQRVTTPLPHWRQRIQALTQHHALQGIPGMINQYRQRIDFYAAELETKFSHETALNKSKVESLMQRLLLLDPERPLKLGYARIEQEDKIITEAKQLEPEKRITLKFQHDSASVRLDPS